jgi:hypothetical protein
MSRFWYLSFVDGDPPRFLGGCLVKGDDIGYAIKEAWRLGINPGGEVLGIPVDQEFANVLPKNVLWSREQLAGFGPITRLGDVPPEKRAGLFNGASLMIG